MPLGELPRGRIGAPVRCATWNGPHHKPVDVTKGESYGRVQSPLCLSEDSRLDHLLPHRIGRNGPRTVRRNDDGTCFVNQGNESAGAFGCTVLWDTSAGGGTLAV